MKKALYPFIILFSVLCISAYGQTKFEKEYRIKRNEVPENALMFVDSISFNKKVKWFKEEGINKTSIEAKTKHRNKKYSIEFNSDGIIEDVEIEISKKEIPLKTFNKISEYLSSKYNKYSIDKIQIQFTGTRESLFEKVESEKRSDELTIKYELVIEARKDKEYKLFEYLFSDRGVFLQKAEIILRNTDNLVY